MLVYKCMLFGYLPEEVISSDLVNFVEMKVKAGEGFKLKSVPEGTNPAPIHEGLIGFYAHYGMAFLSSPDHEYGLSAIDTDSKRIIYTPNEPAFYRQRDAYVYFQPGSLYIRESYAGVLREFAARGYRLFEFSPQGPGDYIIRHRNPAQLTVGAEIPLEKLLA